MVACGGKLLLSALYTRSVGRAMGSQLCSCRYNNPNTHAGSTPANVFSTCFAMVRNRRQGIRPQPRCDCYCDATRQPRRGQVDRTYTTRAEQVAGTNLWRSPLHLLRRSFMKKNVLLGQPVGEEVTAVRRCFYPLGKWRTCAYRINLPCIFGISTEFSCTTGVPCRSDAVPVILCCSGHSMFRSSYELSHWPRSGRVHGTSASADARSAVHLSTLLGKR